MITKGIIVKLNQVVEVIIKLNQVVEVQRDLQNISPGKSLRISKATSRLW